MSFDISYISHVYLYKSVTIYKHRVDTYTYVSTLWSKRGPRTDEHVSFP